MHKPTPDQAVAIVAVVGVVTTFGVLTYLDHAATKAHKARMHTLDVARQDLLAPKPPRERMETLQFWNIVLDEI